MSTSNTTNTTEECWIIDTHYTDSDKLLIEMLSKHINIIAITTVGREGFHPNEIKQEIESDLKKLNIKNIQVIAGAVSPYINYQEDLGDEKIHNPYLFSSDNPETKMRCMYSPDIDSNNIASLKIIELVEKHKKNLSILTTGSLTNLSLAALVNSDLSSKFNNLYITGGSVDNVGNSGNMAEYNFRYDPVAIQIVFRHYKNIRLIPLEVEKLHSKDISSCIDQFKNDIGLKYKNRILEVNNKNQSIDNYSNYSYSILPLYTALVI